MLTEQLICSLREEKERNATYYAEKGITHKEPQKVAQPLYHAVYSAAALLAMQSAVIATAIPSLRLSVCHTLVLYSVE